MNRNLIFVLILIIGLVLQITFFSLFTPWGVKPDLVLVIIIVISILEGPKTGLLMGILGGMLQDIFLGEIISVNVIIKAPMAFLLGFLEEHLYKDNYFLAPVITFVASILHYLLMIVLSEELIFNIDYWASFKTVILPSSLYNAVLGAVLYFMLYKLFNYGENYGR